MTNNKHEGPNVKGHELSRRTALSVMAGAAGAALAAPHIQVAQAETSSPTLKGNVKHSACRWCYQKTPLEELCVSAKAVGVQSIELLKEDEWPVALGLGLECAVAYGPTAIGRGWNDPKHADKFVAEAERLIPMIAEAGIPNMICFSGLRRRIDDTAGLKNCAKGLQRITGLAEKAGVTIIMELLNSERDHPYYMCDHTEWGANLVNEVASDRFKLLYDIYHMQIMEGDVIATIQENIQHIAHFHTGGVPGRHELDDTQELNYRTIIQAIMDTGYTGYIGQEFIPSRDPMTSLAEAVRICDV